MVTAFQEELITVRETVLSEHIFGIVKQKSKEKSFSHCIDLLITSNQQILDIIKFIKIFLRKIKNILITS